MNLPARRSNLACATPAMMKEDGGPSMAERMKGVYWRGADNSRVAGWDQVRSRLVGTEGKPGALHLCDVHASDPDIACPCSTTPINPEDLDSDGEDHAADALRYGAMSRPWKSEPA